MNERQIEMIKTLILSVSPMTVDDIREKFSISERTVKYDISAIRKDFKKHNLKVLNKKGIGYYISPKEKPIIIKNYSLCDDALTKQRSVFENIMVYMLLVNDPAKSYNIADRLYYSEMSIRNFIREGSESLSGSMSIKQVDETDYSLFGSERDIRRYYVALLFEKMSSVRKQEITKMFKNAFPQFEESINENMLSRIERILKARITHLNIWISESTYIKLFLHLYVVHRRKENTVHYSEKDFTFFKDFTSEYDFAEALLLDLYWGDVDSFECLNFTEVMIDNSVFVDRDLNLSIESRLADVLDNMIHVIDEKQPRFKVNTTDFKHDVKQHLKEVLRRNQLEITEKPNPLHYQIKQKYNAFFCIAKELYQMFCDEFEVPYSDDEVSYLTIYLYKNTLQKIEKVYKTYIVCGTGRGFSKLLKTRIMNRFENIEVLDSLSSFHLLKRTELTQADFVISTIDLPKLDIPVIKVSSFLGREDINNIQQLLDYGVQVSPLSLPLNEESTLVRETRAEDRISEENAVIFSEIFLGLFDLMVDFPPEYEVDQEKILGITIHLIIALPRYYAAGFNNEDQELMEEVIRIEKAHPQIAKRMSSFLDMIENKIGYGIPYEERYALYQYIITEGDRDGKRKI